MSSEKTNAANHDYYQIKNLTAALVTVANVALGTHKYQEDNPKETLDAATFNAEPASLCDAGPSRIKGLS
jgi:hypothetical protein